MKLKNALIGILIIYLVLTGYPIICFLAGVTPIWILTPITTLLGFTFALLHAGYRIGWKRAGLLLGCVFFISLLLESVGVATGMIYGPYHYTNKLGPLFLGLVPYLIPVAWFMMSYPSLVMADWIVPVTWKRWVRLISVSALEG